MNRRRDDEYGDLQDLLGRGEPDGGWDDDAADGYGSPPPDVAPEYEDAWRQGYESARRDAEPTIRIDRPDRPDRPGRPDPAPRPEQAERPGPAHRPEAYRVQHSETPSLRSDAEPSAAAQARPDWSSRNDLLPRRDWAAHGPEAAEATPAQDDDRRRPLLLAGLAALALLLVAGAFGVGRLFADESAGSSADESILGPDGAGQDGAGQDRAGQDRAGQDRAGQDRAGQDGAGADAAYQGRVDAVQIAGSSATCQTADSVDAAGNPTSYEPALAHDADLTTAWRCDGRGAGERFTITLPERTTVVEVGMVPGYAKTDPANGIDRYAENNRITRVRWTFDDGTSVVQRMSGASGDRSMRTMRVPATQTRKVVIEILRSAPGTRNTVAISEVRIAQPAGA